MATAPSTQRGNLIWLGYLMVAASATFAAGNGVFASLIIHTGVDPSALAATRIYGAGAILIFFFLPHIRKLRRGHVLPLALFGLVGLVLGQGAYFQAISHADVALVLVIIFTAPLVVAVYERVHLKEMLPAYAWGAIVVSVGGVALAILGQGGMPAISFVGFLFALVAMIAYAVSVILAARLPTVFPPLARTGACMVIAAVIWAFIVPPWTLPFDKLGETTTFVGRFGFSLPVWMAVLFVILIGSIGVYVAWVGGTALVGAGASSMVGMAEPVLGAVFAGASWASTSPRPRASGLRSRWRASSLSSVPACARPALPSSIRSPTSDRHVLHYGGRSGTIPQVISRHVGYILVSVLRACTAVVARQRFRPAAPTGISVAEL